MTNQEKKQYLMKYKNLVLEIEQEIEELHRWKLLSTKITTTYSDMPKSSLSDDKIQMSVEKIIELSDKINSDINKNIQLRNDIESAIRSVEDETLRELLQYRYINGCNMREVARKIHYTRRHTDRLHARALCQIVIPKE